MLLDKNDKTHLSRIGDTSLDTPAEIQNSG